MHCDLFNQNYIQTSIDRVKFAYELASKRNQKLYVAYSGGKDSTVLYGIIKLASEQMKMKLNDMAEFHYALTTVDPPELVYFIKSRDFVIIDYPEKTMWDLIKEHKMPPTRLIRFCCAKLKETKGHDRILLTGVRWAESTNRKKNRGAFETAKNKTGLRVKINDNDEMRKMHEMCLQNKQNIINPIIDWDDYDVWRFIKEQKLEYCSLYDKGYKRLGCIGCPMQSGKMRMKQFLAYPKYFNAYLLAFKKIKNTDWKDEHEVMKWWLNIDDKTYSNFLNQIEE